MKRWIKPFYYGTMVLILLYLINRYFEWFEVPGWVVGAILVLGAFGFWLQAMEERKKKSGAPKKEP
ncbi:hypothetical protein [Pararhodonellum marinum]|uniref:hypothetical protein n=1 Tax=Pararhodonellum marinum TaxID=2755358 RepID=UPI00188F9A91|nr:hypothetical protein [Pararhodonellum marinum]